MTLQSNNPQGKPPQTRTQKIVMWSVFGVAAVLAIIAIVIFIRSGAPFF
jgi:hypothetical protein